MASAKALAGQVFNAYDDETTGDIYTDTFRAADRDAAKAHVRKRHPNARF